MKTGPADITTVPAQSSRMQRRGRVPIGRYRRCLGTPSTRLLFVPIVVLFLYTAAPFQIRTAYALADPRTVTALFSLTRIALSFLTADPQGALIGGNRLYLKEINQRLKLTEERLRLVQATLLDLPRTIDRALERHDAKHLIHRLQTHLLRIDSIETDFQLRTRVGFKTAWRDKELALTRLKGDIRHTLIELKATHTLAAEVQPLLMVARTAAYGILLHVSGQIIAIQSLSSGLASDIAQVMGFGTDLHKRRSAESLWRKQLADDARDDVKFFLEYDLLNQLIEAAKMLRQHHETEGHLRHWFPIWMNIHNPPNRAMFSTPDELYTVLDDIAGLLQDHCPNGEHVKTARIWMRTLLFELDVVSRDVDAPSPHTTARAKAELTERQCDLHQGQLDRLRRFPFSTTSRFRTPRLIRLVTMEEGETLFLRSKAPDVYTFEDRQYEVDFEFTTVPRIEETWPTKEKWASPPQRLPGLDMMAYWILKDPSRVPDALRRETTHKPILTDRRAFFWDGIRGFDVHYVHIRDLLADSADGTRLQETQELEVGQRLCRGEFTVWYMRLHSTPLRAAIEDRFRKIQSALNKRLPRAKFMSGDWRRCNLIGNYSQIGIPWKPKLGQVGGPTSPELWANKRNGFMRKLEWLLHVQAELERSYQSFHDFAAQLEAGDHEPALQYTTHPGKAAGLITYLSRDPGKIAKMLQLDEYTSEMDGRFAVLRISSDRKITRENERAKVAAALHLMLAVSQLTYEYAASKAEVKELDADKNAVQLVGEVDIENVDPEAIVQLADITGSEPGSSSENPKWWEAFGLSEKPVYDPHVPPIYPFLNFVGALKAGKAIVIGLNHAGRRVARLWLKRRLAGGATQTVVLYETLKASSVAVLKGGKSLVTLPGGASKSEAHRQAWKTLRSTFKNSKKKDFDVSFDKKLSFQDVVKLGRDWVCRGPRSCMAILAKVDYKPGLVLRSGVRQFRIGKKGGKGLMANFEDLGKKTIRNGHYTLIPVP